MNCDEAFDRLTAPRDTEDALLDAHLADCARCRAMQETLSPAINWLTAENDLPGDWEQAASAPSWHLTAEAVRLAEQTCRRLQTELTPTVRPVGFLRRHERWWMLGAVSLLTFFAVCLPPERAADNTPPTTRVPEAAGCLWQTDFHREGLAQVSARQVIASCAACHLATP